MKITFGLPCALPLFCVKTTVVGGMKRTALSAYDLRTITATVAAAIAS